MKFYLGGYGDFDNMAKNVCKQYKKENPNCSLLFISPYLNDKYFKNREFLKTEYDGIIYPDIENTPAKYAILKRNQWMVKQADLIITYVNYSFGGASKSLEFAKKLNKTIINLGKQN